jgi:hypothetical protein
MGGFFFWLHGGVVFFRVWFLFFLVSMMRTIVLMVELALLNDAPRAATVRALSNLKVAKLDKRAFQRLLGPIKDIMARNDPRLQQQQQQQ